AGRDVRECRCKGCRHRAAAGLSGFIRGSTERNRTPNFHEPQVTVSRGCVMVRVMSDFRECSTDAALDILIATYNRRDSLERTIKSIFAARPGAPFRLTVIDNNSDDSTAELVRGMIAHYGEHALAYLYEGRQGRSHALNTAIAATSRPLVGFIDD